MEKEKTEELNNNIPEDTSKEDNKRTKKPLTKRKITWMKKVQKIKLQS